MKQFIFIPVLLAFCACLYAQPTKSSLPVIHSHNGNFVFFVDGKPFTMLAGELGNSSTSHKAYMNPIWPMLKEMNLNTALVPVYWELMEPEEGKFDFSLIDEMLRSARVHNLKLVLLWFGTYKNSMSCYAPQWVKLDTKRFPRTLDRNGKPAEIASPFYKPILDADIRAFKALMGHIKMADADQQTVIMVQVENEIGQLPDARDYSDAANKAFEGEVPAALTDYLKKNKKQLGSHVEKMWAQSNYCAKGSWEQVFGKSLATDELFVAWHYAVFTEQVAKAGKAVYNLPMYVNCALNRPQVEPGKYPSGGPLPHLIEIWQAGAPSLDMLSPDIYHGDFREWCKLYDRPNNAVFVPEIQLGNDNGAQAMYVVGRHKAIGFSPFSIESTPDHATSPLAKSYKIITDLSDLMTANPTGINGFYLDKNTPSETVQMGNYMLKVAHEYTLSWAPKADVWPVAGCLVVHMSKDEFWVGGSGVVVTVTSIDPKQTAGLLSVDECEKNDSGWQFRRLNGDQTHQGRHMCIPQTEWGIQRVKIYSY